MSNYERFFVLRHSTKSNLYFVTNGHVFQYVAHLGSQNLKPWNPNEPHVTLFVITSTHVLKTNPQGLNMSLKLRPQTALSIWRNARAPHRPPHWDSPVPKLSSHLGRWDAGCQLDASFLKLWIHNNSWVQLGHGRDGKPAPSCSLPKGLQLLGQWMKRKWETQNHADFPPTMWPLWLVLTVGVKACCLMEVVSSPFRIFPQKKHTKWLLWNAHVHFDSGGVPRGFFHVGFHTLRNCFCTLSMCTSLAQVRTKQWPRRCPRPFCRHMSIQNGSSSSSSSSSSPSSSSSSSSSSSPPSKSPTSSSQQQIINKHHQRNSITQSRWSPP